jgi:DNA-binding transcriptional LysR family regulator
MKVDLNLLVVFDAVMTERHVTRAAARLGLTQPSVSNALNRLRDVTGDELFLKVPGGVSPTPKAAELWAPIRSGLAQIRGALDPAPFDPGTASATFTIALTDYMAALFIPQLLGRLSVEAPGIDLRLVPNTNINAPALLDRGEIDMALGVFPSPGPRLRAHTLLSEHYVCAMRKGHPLAKEALSLETFASAGHVVISLTGEPTGFIDRLLQERGLTRRVVLTVNQFSLAPVVVSQSDLLATLTYRAVRRSGLEEALHLVRIPLNVPPNQVKLLWHERDQQDSAHCWLRDRLTELAAHT